MRQQRGAALLLVLWVVGLLSVLLGGLAVSVQLQQRQARWQGNQAQAAFAAQAGFNLAVANLLGDDSARWPADGTEHPLRFAGSTLRVSVVSERGKLDLNATPTTNLERLLLASGASAERSKTITQALGTRRNKVPLRMLEEFRELPGMTYAIYDRALPFITVWSGTAQPAPSLADPALAKALGLPRYRGVALDAGQILTVTSAATLPSGFQSRLQATFVLLPAYAGGKPYRVLRWQD
ncbi:general secretion pathway protein GspK [Pseudomonas sp. BN505]|uniref:General secretion pathway protein GspK n=1 Tax=Pseudomonas hunanensis TaxID=1247546 RepID=A0ABD6NK26_9PSED|nr:MULTISPECIES: general secretion pathway protein GspK [Pseudomonas]MDH4846017.1 general secretion pathway protein GspK [Pseudomonas sp. BN605]MDH4858126.1 general secretion pathway protein GspK [Pseudomonas sp. BN505]NWL49605.1 general secretion pathway protein GspK [Pseudomonas hunanensis]